MDEQSPLSPLPDVQHPADVFKARIAQHLSTAACGVAFDLWRSVAKQDAKEEGSELMPPVTRSLRMGIQALTAVYKALTELNGAPDDEEELGDAGLAVDDFHRPPLLTPQMRRSRLLLHGGAGGMHEPIQHQPEDLHGTLNRLGQDQRKAALSTALERAKRANAPDDVLDGLERELREVMGLAAPTSPDERPALDLGRPPGAGQDDDEDEDDKDPNILRDGPLGLGPSLIAANPGVTQVLQQAVMPTATNDHNDDYEEA